MNRSMLSMMCITVLLVGVFSGIASTQVDQKFDQEAVSQAPPADRPIWQYLDQMVQDDKVNARIHLDSPGARSPAQNDELNAIRTTWNDGGHDQAIERLRMLEQGEGVFLSVGISWINPKPCGAGGWNDDIQISPRSYTRETCLDFHEGTGNLFVVINRADDYGAAFFTVNMSKDHGATWSETYQWTPASGYCMDASAVVLDSYLYLGFVMTAAPDQAHLLRFNTYNGDRDSLFYEVVFDENIAIREVSLASDEDEEKRLIYCGLLADGSINVILLYDHVYLIDLSPNLSDADRGLDCSWNGNYLDNILAFGYIDVDGYPSYGFFNDPNWTISGFATVAGESLSISTYQNNCILIFDDGIGSIHYFKTDDMSQYSHWFHGILIEGQTGHWYFSPDVTARRGGGMAVVYHEECGVHDRCWFTRTDYSNTNWSTPETFNEIDVDTGDDMSIEWLPAVEGTGHQYGMIWNDEWVSSDSGYPFFDRTDQVDTLFACPEYILEIAPSTVDFTLLAGRSNANRNYLLLAGVSGTTPGYTLPGGLATMPLNFDAFTYYVVFPLLNTPVFMNFMGKLDGEGKGTAQLNAPAVPGYAGLILYFDYCLNGPFDFVSNPVEIEVVIK